MTIRGHKIVTAAEMQKIEKLAQNAGVDLSMLMDRAGVGIARHAEKFIYEYQLPQKILLLAGKGNKAGDAYTAGALLLTKGFYVEAFQLCPLEECSPLCQERCRRFQELGGIVKPFSPFLQCEFTLILDGLLGTGFQGRVEGKFEEAIVWANQTQFPIIAIDIPSGLNGSTGAVETVAIEAQATMYLGLPKLGFFIGKGWDFVGKLLHTDIGLEAKWVDQAEIEALLLDSSSLTLPPLQNSQHKFERGYVLGIAGSAHMPGAAALASTAALRSGAGIIRLFSMPEMPTHHLIAEVIHEEFRLSSLLEESKRAAAFFVGPGLGRTPEVETLLKELLPRLDLPCVLDADALYFLAKNSAWKIPAHAILTPHKGEMKQLLKKDPSFNECQNFVDHHQTTVVLKGGPTVIFHPGKKPLVVTEGDPGMATAGSGDVLTGILAALLAQKLSLEHAAALGVYLHGYAGQLAAAQLTSYDMIASDILNYLPEAFRSL